MKRYDVTALRELLIDFTENGKGPKGILCLRQITEALLTMYWQCWRS